MTWHWRVGDRCRVVSVIGDDVEDYPPYELPQDGTVKRVEEDDPSGETGALWIELDIDGTQYFLFYGYEMYWDEKPVVKYLPPEPTSDYVQLELL